MEGGFGRRTAIVRTPRAATVGNAKGDNRFAPRRNSAVPAFIYFDGTTVSLPCLIRDMSTTGAKLELRSGWDNPFRSDASDLKAIKLVIRNDRVMYECEIVRRAETELGVKFRSTPKPISGKFAAPAQPQAKTLAKPLKSGR